MPSKNNANALPSAEGEGAAAAASVSLTQFLDKVAPSSLSLEREDHGHDAGHLLGPNASSSASPSPPVSWPMQRLLASSITQELDVMAILRACLTCCLCGAYFRATGAREGEAAGEGEKTKVGCGDPVVLETCGHCFCMACIDVGLEHGCSILSKRQQQPEEECDEEDGWPWTYYLPQARRPAASRGSPQKKKPQRATDSRRERRPEMRTRIAAGGVAEQSGKRHRRGGGGGGGVVPDTVVAQQQQEQQQAPCKHRGKRKSRRRFTCPLCDGPAFRWTLVRLPLMQALCDALDKPTTNDKGSSGGLLPGLGDYLTALRRPLTGDHDGDGVSQPSIMEVPSDEEGDRAAKQRPRMEREEAEIQATTMTTVPPSAPDQSSREPSVAPQAGNTQCSVELFPPPPQQRQRPMGRQHSQEETQLATPVPAAKPYERAALSSSASSFPPRAVAATATTSVLSFASPGPAHPDASVSHPTHERDTNSSGAHRPPPPSRSSEPTSLAETDAPPLPQRQERSDNGADNGAVLGASPPVRGENGAVLGLSLEEADGDATGLHEPEGAQSESLQHVGGALPLSQPSPSPLPLRGSLQREAEERSATRNDASSTATPSPPQTLLTGFYRDLIYDDTP